MTKKTLAMTRYIYSGPRSAASLRVGSEQLDVPLIPGQPCELPASHEYTQTLIAMKYLVPEPANTVASGAGKEGGKA